MQTETLAIALVLMMVDRVLMALKWRQLLNLAETRLSRFAVIRYYFHGWLVGAFLPSLLGGDFCALIS